MCPHPIVPCQCSNPALPLHTWREAFGAAAAAPFSRHLLRDGADTRQYEGSSLFQSHPSGTYARVARRPLALATLILPLPIAGKCVGIFRDFLRVQPNRMRGALEQQSTCTTYIPWGTLSSESTICLPRTAIKRLLGSSGRFPPLLGSLCSGC